MADSLARMPSYLHTCYRIGDIDRSVAFYEKLGFQEARRMPIGDDDEDLDYADSVSESLDEGDYPQLTARARRIDELRPVPRDLANLVAACLDPSPELRPSVDELMRRLERLG